MFFFSFDLEDASFFSWLPDPLFASFFFGLLVFKDFKSNLD